MNSQFNSYFISFSKNDNPKIILTKRDQETPVAIPLTLEPESLSQQRNRDRSIIARCVYSGKANKIIIRDCYVHKTWVPASERNKAHGPINRHNQQKALLLQQNSKLCSQGLEKKQ